MHCVRQLHRSTFFISMVLARRRIYEFQKKFGFSFLKITFPNVQQVLVIMCILEYTHDHMLLLFVIFIWWSPFIPSSNLDEVFTYNYIYMALISLRSRSHVKASMVLTRADHLFIHNYIRSLLNNILRPIL